MSRRIIYGHAWLHDCLAFADGETAQAEADELAAILSAKTFAEAASIVTSYLPNPAQETLEDGAVEPDEPFDIFHCYGVEDGDWPPMVTSRALTLLPAAIRDEFGKVVNTSFSGAYLDVPVEQEGAVVSALAAAGFAVSRDDNLINVLDGRTFNPVSDDPEQTAVWPPTAV